MTFFERSSHVKPYVQIVQRCSHLAVPSWRSAFLMTDATYFDGVKQLMQGTDEF